MLIYTNIYYLYRHLTLESLCLQLISDANKMITHVDPRFPGCVNDAYVMRMSEVGHQGEHGGFG